MARCFALLMHRALLAHRPSVAHWNLDRTTIPILGYPIVVRIIHRSDLPYIAGQKVKIIGVCAWSFHHRMVALVNQDNIAIMYRQCHVELGIPSVNALNGKTVRRLEGR